MIEMVEEKVLARYDPVKTRVYRRKYQNHDLLNGAVRTNEGRPWNKEELAAITAPDRPCDHTLSLRLGRSLNAIQSQRCLAKKLRRCSVCRKKKSACRGHKNRKTGAWVCTTCGRKKPDPQKRKWLQKKHITKNEGVPGAFRNYGRPWTTSELERVVDPNRPSDHVLQVEIGRSLHSIAKVRYLRNKRLKEAV